MVSAIVGDLVYSNLLSHVFYVLLEWESKAHCSPPGNSELVKENKLHTHESLKNKFSKEFLDSYSLWNNSYQESPLCCWFLGKKLFN